MNDCWKICRIETFGRGMSDQRSLLTVCAKQKRSREAQTGFLARARAGLAFKLSS